MPPDHDGGLRTHMTQRGLTLCESRRLSPSLDLSSLPAISRCVIAFKCLQSCPAPLCCSTCELCESLRRRSRSRSRAAYKCLIYASKCLNRSQKDFAMANAAAWAATPLWPLWRHFELTGNHRHSQLIPSMHSDDADTDDDDDDGGDEEHIIIIGCTDLGAVPLFALSYKSIHRQLKPRCALCPRRVRISWMRSAIYTRPTARCTFSLV